MNNLTECQYRLPCGYCERLDITCHHISETTDINLTECQYRLPCEHCERLNRVCPYKFETTDGDADTLNLTQESSDIT